MKEKIEFVRPDYGIIYPDNQRNVNINIYRILSLFTLIFLIIYSIYVFHTFYTIAISANALINAFIFTVEMLIGYYSILLFYHLARGFSPINHPLTGRFNSENIDDDNNLPFISVMLPMYKEPFKIVKQTIYAALDINYPTDKYELVIVDDSEQNDVLEVFCKDNGLRYITRDNRKGFKAGGINNALKYIESEFILFIDADHIVERNILKNCLLAIREDTIAVQTRIDFVNMRTYLTSIAAFLQLQFFSLYQRARRPTGSAIFAGGATLFNTKILKSFNGFDPLTIADDTDNSFIFRANGYRIEYIDIVGAWALTPWDPLHLIRQIWRWLTGITRSFRARVFTILRGKSPLYVKIDHFSVGFFPTLSILGWGIAFIFIYLVRNDIELVRSPLLNNTILGISVMIISTLSIITGTLAIFLDDKRILLHKKNIFYKIYVILGFYLLILAAQPLLIGAIFKAWTGVKVSFNRTPKEKKTDDNLSKVMRQYVVYTSVVFLTGLLFLYYALSIPLSDARSITLLISAYAGILPLLIALAWYWKLEGYLDKVSDLTAIDVLKEHALDS